jgi:hypothetical protein
MGPALALPATPSDSAQIALTANVRNAHCNRTPMLMLLLRVWFAALRLSEVMARHHSST